MSTPQSKPERKQFLDMSRYQWLVLFAAWLGWGFDVFDGLLFNFVAPSCVPTLLGLKIGSPEAAKAVPLYAGWLTSILLVGWAVGGIVFGKVCDQIGRTKTLMITMAMYSLGTAMCAFAQNIPMLIVFRIIASLGIGGEWAAGASMVAEVVPEKRRVEAGALLYTSAPLGILLATFVSTYIQGVAFKGDPATSWRIVFLFGLIPAFFAFIVRMFVKEPDRWQEISASARPTIKELFDPRWIRLTLSGLGMAFVALVMWWTCNAFTQTLSKAMAANAAKLQGLGKIETTQLMENWAGVSTTAFAIGGLIGTLLTVPLAKRLGRKAMFAIYFAGSAVAIMATFGLPWPDLTRLQLYFFIGLTVFGVFGSFTYYLPELFPTRLRATGAGFCYNAGRILTAGGPILVGTVAKSGVQSMFSALFWVGVVPILGLFALPWVVETKGRELED